MFDSELFEISEKNCKSINSKDIQKRNREMEKAVLEIIKKYAYTIDKNGMSKIQILSKASKGYNAEYEILKSIINSGRQKYFEEEYSLYYVSNEHVEAYSDVYNIITFVWNSIEYNIKNTNETKKR